MCVYVWVGGVGGVGWGGGRWLCVCVEGGEVVVYESA